MKKNILLSVAFINGALVMVLEITGARLIAPFFGNTFFVWSSLISVILASLSIGYYYGGKLADRKNGENFLLHLIWVSGFTMAYLIFFKNPVIYYFATQSVNPVWLVALSSLLFGPPTFVFGMISPLVMRLGLQGIKDSGQTIGQFFAVSTLGSIVGTLITGYVLLLLLGSSKILIMILLGIILEFILAWKIADKKEVIYVYLFISLLLITLFSGAVLKNKQVDYLAEKDTLYNRIIVTQVNTPEGKRRLLLTDFSTAQSVIDPDQPDQLVAKYHQVFAKAFELKDPNTINKVLAIGGGAFNIPTVLATKYPDTNFDVVEIDPALEAMAKEFFFFEDRDNINIHTLDGRMFLAQRLDGWLADQQNQTSESSSKLYDVIFLDAYMSKYAPFHLTTAEFMSQLERNLAPDGILMVNMIGQQELQEKNNFMNAMYHTIGTQFAFRKIIPTKKLELEKTQNHVLVASRSELNLDENFPGAWQPTSPEFILTDDYAPVDHLFSY